MKRQFFTVTLFFLALPFLGLAQETTQQRALLITSELLKSEWQPFVEWKLRRGITTHIHTVEEINRANRNNIIDTQEKIRQFIDSQISTKGIRWVILGGDSLPNGGGLVPDRDTQHSSFKLDRPKVPTDLFYLSKKNWDDDGDGSHGEFDDDRIAIDYPNRRVGLGRIPVRTAADVKAYTVKVIEFESNSFPKDFYSKMLYTCAVARAEPKLKTSWLNISRLWPEGQRNILYTTRSSWDQSQPGDFHLSPKNLIDVINQKQMGRLHIHGHGLNQCWIIDKEHMLHYQMLGQLKNQSAYPVITTVSCYTGEFDSQSDPSISEAMLRIPHAGAIAIVAPSREGKAYFMDQKSGLRDAYSGQNGCYHRIAYPFLDACKRGFEPRRKFSAG